MHLQNLLTAVIALSSQAGAAILDIYARADHEVVSKSDHSPLTAADLAAHHIIQAGLEALTPDLPILSEESVGIPWAIRQTWTRYWLVDPLDGTKEFIKRNGEFTVNIALIDEGVPVLGVVYVPVLDLLYYGAKGEGAWKQVGPAQATSVDASSEMSASVGSNSGKAPSAASSSGNAASVGSRPGDAASRPGDAVSAPSSPGNAASAEMADRPVRITTAPVAQGQRTLRVVASRNHRGEQLDAWLHKAATRYPELELLSMGSSLKICLVAEGKADIYPRLALTAEWDTAAAQAVLEAAGGVLVDSEGRDYRYNRKDTILNPYFFAAGDAALAKELLLK